MGKIVTLTTSLFIERSRKIHKDKFDYSLVECCGTRSIVKILCPFHGVFEQVAGSHLRGQGCKKCLSVEISNIVNFASRSNIVHNNKYDYSIVNYINNKTKVEIICPDHGIFKQKPDSHLNGSGCNKCAIEYKSRIFRYDSDFVIAKMQENHGNKYKYDLVEYVNNKSMIKIICPDHGIFEQQAYSHMKGFGCYLCNESFGEVSISNILNGEKIEYEKEKTFDGCVDKKKLPFDFYLPNFNICIEFDGKQHFEPIEYFGGEITFLSTKKHDEMKNNFCQASGIEIYRIKYLDDVSEKMSEILSKIRSVSCQS